MQLTEMHQSTKSRDPDIPIAESQAIECSKRANKQNAQLQTAFCNKQINRCLFGEFLYAKRPIGTRHKADSKTQAMKEKNKRERKANEKRDGKKIIQLSNYIIFKWLPQYLLR